jgi:VanZ family protein
MDKKKHIPQLKKWIFLSIFTGIMLLSLVPLLKISNLSKTESLGVRSDYLIHFFVFLSLIFSLKIWKNESFYSKNKSFTPWILASYLLAIISESWQIIIPTRIFNPYDLTSNLSGCLLASTIFFIKKKNKS